MEYYTFRAMNTDLVLAAEGEPGELQEGFRQTQRFIQASEARFTRFSETSELAQLNRSSGAWFTASPDLYEVLAEAREYAAATRGRFDPSILDALERAGYDKSMEEIDKSGVSMPTPAAVAFKSRFAEIEFDAEAQAVLLPEGVRVDLGGIAKGWIAEHAAHRLAEFSNACAVNAGGDLFAVGLPQGASGWRIALEDPRDPAQTLAVLKVGAGAVATSSITRRRWLQGARVQHHLIDPRTGEPAETDWLSVTAIAPRATTAEVLAKCLLIAGSQGAPELAASHKDVEFIAVDTDGRLLGSQNAAEYAVEYLDVGIK
jgi:FAD:protein FMN transferase